MVNKEARCREKQTHTHGHTDALRCFCITRIRDVYEMREERERERK